MHILIWFSRPFLSNQAAAEGEELHLAGLTSSWREGSHHDARGVLARQVGMGGGVWVVCSDIR